MIGSIILLRSGMLSPLHETRQLTKYTRFRAFLALIEIHLLGILHNDFRPSNVAVDAKGSVRIIDFGDATLHKCLVVDRAYKLYEREPSPTGDLRCDEVYDTGLMMDIWTPGTYFFRFTWASMDLCNLR